MKKIIFFLMLGVIMMGLMAYQPARAQTPNASPTPTFEPTLVALGQKVTDLENSQELLNQRKDVDKQALENEIQKALMPVYVWFAVLSALGISAAVSFSVWINTYLAKLKKQVEEETRQKLDQAFYNADPLYFPLYLPAQGFEIETKRLKKLGFKDVRPYGGLRPALLNGIIVVRIPGDNFKDSPEDCLHAKSVLDALKDFIIKNKANEKQVAFVLYITGGNLPDANEFTAKYDNVVIANMPVTVAGHVYALVRGLTTVENETKEAE